jgi:hypothetical protein
METRRGILRKLAMGALGVMSRPGHLPAFFHAPKNQNDSIMEPYHAKVNCAGPAIDGFSEDQLYRPGSWGYTHGGQYFMCDSVSNDFGIPAAIKTLRYSCGAPFHYKFDVPNGLYRVKLYFVSPNELYGPRVFDVVINGAIVLENFRAFPVNTGFLKQFDGTPVTGGQIDITFRCINDACLINAIELEQTSSVRPSQPWAEARSVSGNLQRTRHDALMISYYGDWTVTTESRHSQIPGSALDFSFKGSTIRWIGSKDVDHGIAEISIDGVLQEAVDTFAPRPISNQVLYERTGLSENKYHTLRILVSKDRHAQATGCYQDVIAFECREPFDAAENDAEAAFREVEIIEAGKQTYLPPGKWRPVQNGAATPENGVALQDGVLRQAFERNVAYQIHQWNLNSTWTNWLPGANDGRRMAGTGNILRWVDNPVLRQNLDSLVTTIASRQRSDGYALPYPDSDMGKVVYGANNERKPYDRRNFTLGLLAAGRVNPMAIRIARKFQDWLYASPYINSMLDGALGIMGDQPNISMYHSPAGRHEDVIAREKYWRQEWWLDQLKDQQPTAISRFPLNRPHCYVLAPWVASCDTYRATGDSKLMDAMLGAWQTYRDHFVHVGGSAAICEDCDNAYPPKSYYLHKHTGENCGGAFWIDFNHRLLQLYPDQEKFASEIEQTLYNVTLANQDASGNIRYHTNLVGTKDSAGAIGTCCEVTNTNVLARLPEFLYSIASDGLYVNLYAASSISWNHRGTQVGVQTLAKFPEDGNVAMKFSASRPLALTLHLRIPSWATGNVSILVNGKRSVAGVPGTYVALSREWVDGDTLTFNIPIGLRITKYTGFDRDAEHDRYALRYGPLLMSLVGGSHLNVEPEKLIGSLSPEPESPLDFRIARHSSCTYKPYFRIQDETFTSFPTLG